MPTHIVKSRLPTWFERDSTYHRNQNTKIRTGSLSASPTRWPTSVRLSCV